MKVSFEHIAQIKRDYYSLGVNHVMSLEQYIEERLEEEGEGDND